MTRLFGTDGVRGVANTELSCQVAFRLGQAAVVFLGSNIVVGKDTRLSGDMLESAVIAGIMSCGGTALQAGIIPTPGIALLTRDLYCDGGIVISASHNPPEYNGIKFFDAQGFKLSVALEHAIEEFVEEEASGTDQLPSGDGVGVAIPVENACELYIDHAVASIVDAAISFEGLKIALDVGHGASALTSAEAFRRLGAEVVVINEDFDGTDINVECGSTHLAPLHKLVAEIGADVGIAHDGDADRVMLVDAEGNELDGDIVETVCALDLMKQKKLLGNTVVSTVMCNLGFTHAMRAAGIEVLQTQVGDRYVLEAMREGGYVLGGEQSGHMIFLEHNSTGDGLVTACQFLAACQRLGKTVTEAAALMPRFPQKLINVKVSDKHALETCTPVWDAVDQATTELGENGRVLVRTSGTEPLVRVMVEAATEEHAGEVAERIAAVVSSNL
ncbi:MAG: phosphoglucosamine mutase [Raoultibacter sp.]